MFPEIEELPESPISKHSKKLFDLIKKEELRYFHYFKKKNNLDIIQSQLITQPSKFEMEEEYIGNQDLYQMQLKMNAIWCHYLCATLNLHLTNNGASPTTRRRRRTDVIPIKNHLKRIHRLTHCKRQTHLRFYARYMLALLRFDEYSSGFNSNLNTIESQRKKGMRELFDYFKQAFAEEEDKCIASDSLKPLLLVILSYTYAMSLPDTMQIYQWLLSRCSGEEEEEEEEKKKKEELTDSRDLVFACLVDSIAQMLETQFSTALYAALVVICYHCYKIFSNVFLRSNLKKLKSYKITKRVATEWLKDLHTFAQSEWDQCGFLMKSAFVRSHAQFGHGIQITEGNVGRTVTESVDRLEHTCYF